MSFGRTDTCTCTVTADVDRDGRSGAGAGSAVTPRGPQPESPSPDRLPSKKSPEPGKTQCRSGKSQCPNYHPRCNGCGPDDWKGKLVPNRPFGMANFKPACDTHDLCYGNCGKEKDSCDKAFLVDMQSACEERWMYLSVDPEPMANVLAKLACYKTAQMYYEAVAKAGNSAYTSAQDEACKCYCSKAKKDTYK